MGTEIKVDVFPKCNFCASDAEYDGKTLHGPWAFMCKFHWDLHGVAKLGTGYGQKLIKRKKT